MFQKATFTFKFDLAHLFSQLKLRPWKNSSCETAYLCIIGQIKEGGQLTWNL